MTERKREMTRKEMMTRCLEALGLDATQKEAEKWLLKEYGVKIVDSVFYTVRKELREQKALQELDEKPNPLLREPGTMRQEPAASKPITLDELRRVKSLIDELGGHVRVAEVIGALMDLGVV